MAEEKRKLYNPHSIVKRDGGPYLDEVERENAEIIRAAKEGRKPDLENPGPTAGTPLLTAAGLVGKLETNSNPSLRGGYNTLLNLAQRVDDDDEIVPAAEVEVTVAAQAKADDDVLDSGSTSKSKSTSKK